MRGWIHIIPRTLLGAFALLAPCLGQVRLLETVIGGAMAEVVNEIGWPGTRGTCRLDVRMPSGIAAGVE
jgi:hypothetical protein